MILLLCLTCSRPLPEVDGVRTACECRYPANENAGSREHELGDFWDMGGSEAPESM